MVLSEDLIKKMVAYALQLGLSLSLSLSLLVLGAAQASLSSLDVAVGGTAFKIEPWGANSVRVRANTAG